MAGVKFFITMSTETKKPTDICAFPSPHFDTESGMSLRDYFASLAIQKPFSYRPANLWQWLKWAFGFPYMSCNVSHNQNAIKAYELADAMLKQREG